MVMTRKIVLCFSAYPWLPRRNVLGVHKSTSEASRLEYQAASYFYHTILPQVFSINSSVFLVFRFFLFISFNILTS